MKKKRAMVLSGGGALGAYEVGVMKALACVDSEKSQEEIFEPDLFTGTSVGAFNAAFLAAQSDTAMSEAVARLEYVWLEVIANQGDGSGVFRYRLDPFEFLNPFTVARFPLRTLRRLIEDTASLSFDLLDRLRWFLEATDESVPDRIASLFDLSAFISMDPLDETLRETIDYERLSRLGKSLIVATTNWTSGRLDLAQQGDMTPEMGPKLIRGSVAIPGIFPPETIGGDKLVDGGVLMNTPLGPAIHDGANEIHVVTLFPLEPTSNHRTLASTIGAMNRAQQYSWDFDVNLVMRNLGIADQFLEQMKRLAQAIEASPASEERQRYLSQLEKLRDTVIDNMGLPDHESLTVHRYRPSQHIAANPLAMLLFERGRIEGLIELGYADTRDHDCTKNGCLTTSTNISSLSPRNYSMWRLRSERLEETRA